ncbi:unnamed protein product [Linum trigynum]|uniref:Uncharacterized protein n=1 Tax=Linum trigynum TaxID=586398 RepID=A0AAV2CDS4_9ROSI
MPEYVDLDLQLGLNLEELEDPEQECDHGSWANGPCWIGADPREDELSLVGRTRMEGGPGGSRAEDGKLGGRVQWAKTTPVRLT